MNKYKKNSILFGIAGAMIMCVVYWGVICLLPEMRQIGDERLFVMDEVMFGVQILIFIIVEMLTYKMVDKNLWGGVLILTLPIISGFLGGIFWKVYNDIGAFVSGYFKHLVMWIILLVLDIVGLELRKKKFNSSIWKNNKCVYSNVWSAFIVKFLYWFILWSSEEMIPTTKVVLVNIAIQTIVYVLLEIFIGNKYYVIYFASHVILGAMVVIFIGTTYLILLDGFGVAACFLYAVYEIGIIVPTVWICLIIQGIKNHNKQKMID